MTKLSREARMTIKDVCQQPHAGSEWTARLYSGVCRSRNGPRIVARRRAPLGWPSTQDTSTQEWQRLLLDADPEAIPESRKILFERSARANSWGQVLPPPKGRAGPRGLRIHPEAAAREPCLQ